MAFAASDTSEPALGDILPLPSPPVHPLLLAVALTELHLPRCGLCAATALTLLSRLPSLVLLNVRDNLFTSLPLSILSPLVLSATTRGGAARTVTFPTGFPSLAEWDLSRNPLGADADVGALLALPALRRVDLSGCPCASAALKALRGLHRGGGAWGVGVGALAVALRGAPPLPRARPRAPPLLPAPTTAVAALHRLLQPLLAFAHSGGGDHGALRRLRVQLPPGGRGGGRAWAPKGGGFVGPAWPLRAAVRALRAAGGELSAHTTARVARVVGAALAAVAWARRGGGRAAAAPSPLRPEHPRHAALQLVPLHAEAAAAAVDAACGAAEVALAAGVGVGVGVGGARRRRGGGGSGGGGGAPPLADPLHEVDDLKPPPTPPPCALAHLPLSTLLRALSPASARAAVAPAAPPPPPLPRARPAPAPPPALALDHARYPLLSSFPALPLVAGRPPECGERVFARGGGAGVGGVCPASARRLLGGAEGASRAPAPLPAAYVRDVVAALRRMPLLAEGRGAPNARLYARPSAGGAAPRAGAARALEGGAQWQHPARVLAPGYRSAGLFRGAPGSSAGAGARGRGGCARPPTAAAAAPSPPQWGSRAAARAPPSLALRGRLALPPSGMVPAVLDEVFAGGAHAAPRAGGFARVVLQAEARADAAALRAAGAGGVGPPPVAPAGAPPRPHRKQHRYLLVPQSFPPVGGGGGGGGEGGGGGGGEGGAPFGIAGAGGAHPSAALRAATRALHSRAAATVATLEALLAATDSRAGASISTLAMGEAVASGEQRRGLLGRVRGVVATGERLRYGWASSS
jgi:hypothetical protein